MTTTRGALTDGDVRALVKGPTPDERAAAARKICRQIERAALTPDERSRAHDILRVMARDAAELVRQALAVTLQASPLVPRDVALRLARDVDAVALPLLNFSPAFSDDDLAEIVRLGDAARQTAVARRPVLSERVTGAIAEHGRQEAVQTAVANDGAAFSESGLQRVLERFEAVEDVLVKVAYRRALPLSVSERLIRLVGEDVRRHLIAYEKVDAEIAEDLFGASTERATVDLVDLAGRAADIKGFAKHLHASGRLNASLLLRALASGHMAFFEHGLSEMAGVPHHRTWLMVHDAGLLGLRAIYDRAGLPARPYPAFRAAVDTYHALAADGRMDDRKAFQRRMLERFLTQPATPGREDMDYLLDRLDAARDADETPAKTAALA